MWGLPRPVHSLWRAFHSSPKCIRKNWPLGVILWSCPQEDLSGIKGETHAALYFYYYSTEGDTDASVTDVSVAVGASQQMFQRGGLGRYDVSRERMELSTMKVLGIYCLAYQRQKNGLLRLREHSLCNDERWVKRKPFLNSARNVSFTVTHMDTLACASSAKTQEGWGF